MFLNKFFNFSILSLSWSIYGYVYKDLLQYLDNIEIKTLFYVICIFFIILAILYALIFDRKQIINYNQNVSKISWLLMGILIFVGSLDLIASFSYYNLLEQYHVLYVIPILRAISTIFISLIGYYFFKESLDRNKIMGIATIILGVYILNLEN
jgi:drug/metabolite transporter (DMT)-like permease